MGLKSSSPILETEHIYQQVSLPPSLKVGIAGKLDKEPFQLSQGFRELLRNLEKQRKNFEAKLGRILKDGMGGEAANRKGIALIRISRQDLDMEKGGRSSATAISSTNLPHFILYSTM